MADSMTQAVFGEKAASRYDNTSKNTGSNAVSALEGLIQAGVTSAFVGDDIDEVKYGQAQQNRDTASLNDKQMTDERRRLMERRQALEEERERVNAAYDRELELNAQELDGCTIMGL